MNADQIGELMEGLGKAATAAAQVLALASTDQKNSALRAAAAAVRARRAAILAANERDMSAARAARLSGPRLERLRLDERRIEAIAESIDAVIELRDPISRFRPRRDQRRESGAGIPPTMLLCPRTRAAAATPRVRAP